MSSGESETPQPCCVCETNTEYWYQDLVYPKMIYFMCPECKEIEEKMKSKTVVPEYGY